jgi:hypothetical protein
VRLMAALTDASELFGFATPFIYAAATFRFFHYLDKKVSDEATAAISGWLRPKEYEKAAVAHAIVEIFDRVYTRPLLGWRALLRSAAITIIIFLAFFYEFGLFQWFSINRYNPRSRLPHRICDWDKLA